jgi:hypothetical protein
VTLRLLPILLLVLPGAVLAQDPLVKQCIARFPPGGARAQCVTPWLDDIVARRSAGAALDAAEGLVKSGVMNVNDCHVMGHAVGHASWRKERDLGRAFRACTQKCIQGCYHGAVEAFMIDGPEGRTSPAQVRAFCDQLGAGSLDRRQCLHGLGHGIMHQYRKDLAEAANACEKVGGRREADLCLGGLWMQWAHFRIHQGAETYGKAAPTMCEGVRSQHLPECARAVGGGAMFATGHDPAKSAEICKAMPAGQRLDCQRGVEYEVGLIKAGLGHAHHH